MGFVSIAMTLLFESRVTGPPCYCAACSPTVVFGCFFARGSIIYNIVDTSSTGIGVTEGGVLVGVHSEDGSQVMVEQNKA